MTMANLRNKRFFWTVFLVVTGLLVVLYTVIFCIRFSSALSQSDLFMTTGVEGPGIYAIWKLQNGHPLYEWPNRDYYTLTIYNYLFYYFYGTVLSAFGITDANILVAGKLVTLVFTSIGAISHWLLMRYLVKDWDSSSVRLYLGMMAFIVWFGASITSWWALTVRPDLPAVALATIGLLIYIKGLDKNSPLQIVIASLFFFVAWSFKQSSVWIFAGTILYSLICKRNWKQALALIFPSAFLMAICLGFGGEVYRYNLFLPSISVLSIKQAIDEFKKVFFPNLSVWGFLIYIPLIFIAIKTAKNGNKRQNSLFGAFSLSSHEVLIVVVTVVTSGIGFIALGRFGSSRNHFFEAIVAASTLSSIYLIKLLQVSRLVMVKAGLIMATLLMLSMTIIPFMQLAFPNRLGLLTRASQQAYADRQAYAQYLSRLPKPLFIRDETFALPWHSSDNKYPAVVLDQNVYFEVKGKGLFQGNGIRDLVNRKYFRSLAIAQKDEVYKAAIDAGYKSADQPLSIPSASGNSRVELVTLVNPGK